MSIDHDKDRLVYSTDQGRICSRCGHPLAGCRCADHKRKAVIGDGVVRVRRETKGRGGKTVTAVSGLPLNAEQLKKMASELKRLCGSGGTVKDAVIEIQGDHCATVIKILSERGYPAKKAGG